MRLFSTSSAVSVSMRSRSVFLSGHAQSRNGSGGARRFWRVRRRLFDSALCRRTFPSLPSVQRALYLLFNEGYHGASAKSAVRFELCHEAMRLAAMLLTHPLGAIPTTYALAALMALCAARLPARLSAGGNLNCFFDQDRSLWDRQAHGGGLQALGPVSLAQSLVSITSRQQSPRFMPAHCGPRTRIGIRSLRCTDTLMAIQPSPIVALIAPLHWRTVTGRSRDLKRSARSRTAAD